MTINTTITLKHSQFLAARALAHAYGHCWGTVPDGTYDMGAIQEYGDSVCGEFGGITMPNYHIEEGFQGVIITHETGTGRLRWEVRESGNVLLEVFRPNDQIRAYQMLEPKYRAASGPEATLVARVDIINDDYKAFKPEEMDVMWHTNNRDLVRGDGEKFDVEYDGEVDSWKLAERHVGALIRPLVALLTINNTIDPIHSQEEYQAYREAILQPAIDRVKEWFKPFFQLADPDPLDTYWVRSDNRSKWDGSPADPLPETYWHRPCATGYNTEKDRYPIYVVHKEEEYPVESEGKAVSIVETLKNQPDMTLIDAISR